MHGIKCHVKKTGEEEIMENLTNTNLVLTNKIYTLKEIEEMSKIFLKDLK